MAKKKRISSSEAEIRRFIKAFHREPIQMMVWERRPNDIVIRVFTPFNDKGAKGILHSFREGISKRQNLKGVTKRLTKAIRGKKK